MVRSDQRMRKDVSLTNGNDPAPTGNGEHVGSTN